MISLSEKIFKDFVCGVDSFDFSLKKNPGFITGKYHYLLQITALAGDKFIRKHTVALETSDLAEAIRKSVKVVDTIAREITPGIKLSGSIAEEFQNRKKISLKLIGPVRPSMLWDDSEDFEEEDSEEEDFEEEDFAKEELKEIGNKLIKTIKDFVNQLDRL